MEQGQPRTQFRHGHDVDEALLLADRVLVLERGRIRTDLRIFGPSAQLIEV